MFRFAFLFLACLPCLAQKPAATIENFSVHKAKEGEEDLDSKFPIVHTGTAASDSRINTLLQTRFFGRPLDEKTKSAVRENFDPRGDQVFSYTVQTERFIGITIAQSRTNNAMSLNGYDIHYPFLFDSRTGQQFPPLVLFSEEGVLLFLGRAFRAMHASYNQAMDRYLDGFSKLKEKAQAALCDCNCEPVLRDVFRNNLALFMFSKDSIAVAMDGCIWQMPGPHDSYTFTVSMNEARRWLSDYGKYMLDGGPDVSMPDTPFLLFEGMLGDNIGTTFTIRQGADHKLSGYEIYNRVGATIRLSGIVNGSQFTFDEVTPEGKPVATFQATLEGGSLKGSWTKSDKSKTMGFAATKY